MPRPAKTAATLAAASLLLLPALAALHAQPPAPTTPPAAKPEAKDDAKDAAKAKEKAASAAIDRIKEEGMKRSHVMETLSYLTDVIGPRLTGSPNLKRANEWTRDTMAKWGLENAHLEAWGPFGRGWSLKRFSAQVVEPQCIPLIASPKAWSPGTDGTLVGEVVYFDPKNDDDFARFKGKLKGAIVLASGPVDVPAHFEPLALRKTDKQLLDLADAPEPAPRGPGRRAFLPENRPLAAGGPAAKDAGAAAKDSPADGAAAKDSPASAKAAGGGNGNGDGRGARGGGAADGGSQPPADREQMIAQARARNEVMSKRAKFLMDEGAALLAEPSRQGDGGTLFVAQATVPGAAPFGLPGQPGARRVSAWDKEPPKMLPQIVVAKEHYNRLVRMIKQGETLKIAVDLSVQFHDDDLMAYNTVAEIPGTDLKEEVVMLGGHMDSWHSGTGATDNAAGVAAAMEAARILKALDLKPRRTVRVALWTGEEQGLLGSRAYVAKHFGKSPASLFGAPTPAGATKASESPDSAQTREFEKFSAYFNLDNGTGKVRGVYLQGNESVHPIFRKWLQPFRELGAQTLTPSNTGGTDHQSFDGIGLPGFQFIQDEIEYNSRTHHSNMDVYDRIQADDMKQASVILATFVYNTAQMDEKLPRKAVPTPPSAR
jgi:hypothetical protein